MKIGLPVNTDKLDGGISPSYGRAPFYYVYNSEENQGIFLENPAAGEPGGVGVKAAQLVIDQKIEVLITPRLGDHAAQVLNEAGIRLYKSQGTDIDENIQAYLAGKLEELKDIHPGLHGH